MTVFLFDLDETLYSRRLGVVGRIDRRINDYLRLRLGVPEDEVDALRRRSWAEHGTTLRGLMAHHPVDPDDYLRYVHDVELADVLGADAELALLLQRLRGRKMIFTNASRAHGTRVLGLLGVTGAFERMFGLEDRDYVPKPVPEAYDLVLAALGAPAESCCLIDDAVQNLRPAKDLGMRTVWLSPQGEEAPDADHVIRRLGELEELFPAP